MYATNGGDGGAGSICAFDTCTATYSPSDLTLYPFIALCRVVAEPPQAYKTIHHKVTKGTKG